MPSKRHGDAARDAPVEARRDRERCRSVLTAAGSTQNVPRAPAMRRTSSTPLERQTRSCAQDTPLRSRPHGNISPMWCLPKRGRYVARLGGWANMVRAAVGLTGSDLYLTRRIAGMLGGNLQEMYMRPDEQRLARALATRGILRRRSVGARTEYDVTTAGKEALRLARG